MDKKSIIDRVIISLLSNKYKDREINEDLIIEIEKEVDELYKKVAEHLAESKRKGKSFVLPRF
jgi:uncharacterized protein with PhoU and TrkA domain